MKNLKNILKLSPVLLLLVFASCKKDKKGPESITGDNNQSPDKEITKEELLDYYIVSERKSGTTKLSVLYFTQENNTVKANLHGKGYLRIKEAGVSNSTFSFDVNDDGTLIYTFAIEKDTDGKLILKSYQFTDTQNSGQGLFYATIAKKSETFSFENSSFKTGDILFKFNGSNLDWDIRSRQTGTQYFPPPIDQTIPVYGMKPEVSVPYYSLANLGWKSNTDEFIGACVPNWKDTDKPLMLVERNSTIYQCAKEQ